VIARVTPHVIRSEAAALGLGRGKLGTQLDKLRLIDGVANSILSCRETAGGKLGLYPLGSIWCEFDFHMASLRPMMMFS
jgi:hypothetical protein